MSAGSGRLGVSYNVCGRREAHASVLASGRFIRQLKGRRLGLDVPTLLARADEVIE